MEENLILEGLLSMVAELKEKQGKAGDTSQPGRDDKPTGCY